MVILVMQTGPTTRHKLSNCLQLSFSMQLYFFAWILDSIKLIDMHVVSVLGPFPGVPRVDSVLVWFEAVLVWFEAVS